MVIAEYRHGAHAVYDIKYHLIWITKYRYKVLEGRVAERARELIRQICQAREVVIIRGAVSPDHIPMLVSAFYFVLLARSFLLIHASAHPVHGGENNRSRLFLL